jgi:hypothetical protein
MPSITKQLHAISRQKLKAAVRMLTGHTILQPTCLNSDSYSDKIADCAGTKKNILQIVRHWHAEMQNLGSYVSEVQVSRKHEGKSPDKPDRQYQDWHNTLTPY